MSLTVKLIGFEVPKAKSNLIGRVEFRGVSHVTSELTTTAAAGSVVDVNQSFIWPLARSATDDEPLIVELRTQTTKTLIKTGFSQASGSWMGSGGGTMSATTGTIASSSKCVGQYIILMQATSWGLLNIRDFHSENQINAMLMTCSVSL
ncbi:uncharacterized protein LOC119633128 isoform X2 [Glossina fuscipes]|uniref:Uncharacterized protein LOC119633128 isoform X2 n=1 Tax=Glossina fuscipes TaxID=7396 RepID=A0A8U0WB49_9MUSC|nr:uncharacterized protein LOC119633128 isoform X2 [Glossina fuscipes]